jgi:hypothetical protein
MQMAAVSVVPTILDYVCDDVIRTQLLPRARNVYTSNGADVKIVLSLLACIAKVCYDITTFRPETFRPKHEKPCSLIVQQFSNSLYHVSFFDSSSLDLTRKKICGAKHSEDERIKCISMYPHIYAPSCTGLCINVHLAVYPCARG